MGRGKGHFPSLSGGEKNPQGQGGSFLCRKLKKLLPLLDRLVVHFFNPEGGGGKKRGNLLGNLCHLGRTVIVLWFRDPQKKKDRGDRKGKKSVHPWTRRDNSQTLAEGKIIESSGVRILDRGGNLSIEPHISAQEKRGDPELRAMAIHPGKNFRTKTDAEALDLGSSPSAKEKMPPFVNDDEDSQHKEKTKDRYKNRHG
jgi:hypothetical protein